MDDLATICGREEKGLRRALPPSLLTVPCFYELVLLPESNELSPPPLICPPTPGGKIEFTTKFALALTNLVNAI